MQLICGVENLKQFPKPTAVSIGNFDGVHAGHQEIIRTVIVQSRINSLQPVVMTFEYHPLKFLHPERAPLALMTLAQKIKAIESLDPDIIVVVRCTRDFLSMNRDEFVREILLKKFNMQVIVEGPNFRFGCDRTGDIDYLIAQGPKLGFTAIKIPPVEIDLPEMGKTAVSSSLVRRLIGDGHVDLVKRCLGRPYELHGSVVSGDQRGRTIGFPTANLNVTGQMLPKNGIYAAAVRIDGTLYPSAVVVGPAPTFEKYEDAVEAFILDYDGNLYDQTMDVLLFRRIRDIIRFSSVDSLVSQIRTDVSMVRDIFQNQGVDSA